MRLESGVTACEHTLRVPARLQEALNERLENGRCDLLQLDGSREHRRDQHQRCIIRLIARVVHVVTHFYL